MELIRKKMFVEALNRDAVLYIALPKHYNEKEKRYPVLYVHDAQSVFVDQDAYEGHSWKLIDLYDQHDDLPEIIVVGLSNAEDERRLYEYGPYPFDERFLVDQKPRGGGAETYLDVIEHTIKPMIDANYKTIPDASSTAMMGASMGGVVTLYAALTKSHVFQRFASLSGAFFVSLPQLVETIQKANSQNIKRFYMDTGDEEEAGGNAEDYLYSNEMIHERLRTKLSPYTLNYRIIAGGKHHADDWARRLKEVLTVLFS